MRLPQDIIDCIISQFGRHPVHPEDLLENYQDVWSPQICPDDPPLAWATLKTFCMVSHDCRRWALRYLFHTIEVTGRTKDLFDKRCHCLLRLLSTSLSAELSSLQPPSAAFIRTISIRRDLLDYYLQQQTTPSVDYLFENDTLTKIFEHLRHRCISVTCLRIDLGLRERSISWHEIPASFQTSLQSLIHSPSLKILALLQVTDMPQQLLHQSTIAALQLGIWSSSDTSAPPAKPSSGQIIHLPHLTHLITNDDFSEQYMQLSLWETSLENLKGCNIDMKFGVNRGLLELTRHSLEVLRVDRVDWTMLRKHDIFTSSSSFNPFNFGAYTHLQKLSITRWREMEDSFKNSGKDEDVMSLVRMLERTDVCSNLHTLIIRILGFYEQVASEDFLVPCVPLGELSVWEELDGVIASPRFPVLRHFKLEITAEFWETEVPFDEDMLKKCTIECFERSFKRTKALKRVELVWVMEEIYCP